MKLCIKIFLLLCSITSISLGQSASIDECRGITEDRARLLCFDELFNTPVHSINPDESVVQPKELVQMKPQEWFDAWKKDQSRVDGDKDFVMTTTPGNFQDSIFLTKPVEDMGLIVLSCVDKISRVEFMLNQPLKDGVLLVTIDGQSLSQKKWLTDDSGYILRMGRGIPSIDEMKNMLGQESVVINLGKVVSSLSTATLAEKIKPLRNSCRW